MSRSAIFSDRLGSFAGVLKYTFGHVPLERDERGLRRIEALISALSPE